MQKIAILYDASQAVLSTFDLDEVLSRILAIARDYFHLTNVAIFLMDKDKQEMYAKALAGWEAKECTTLVGTVPGRAPFLVQVIERTPSRVPPLKEIEHGPASSPLYP